MPETERTGLREALQKKAFWVCKEGEHQPRRAVDIEDAVEVFKQHLQQNNKFHYLTEKEAKMPRKEVNLQVALGVRLCKTLADVCELLNDVRDTP